MILQVATDAIELMDQVDAQALEQGGRADAGALENAGRADGAGAEDDFPARSEGAGLALPARGDLAGPAVLQEHAVDIDSRQHRQVRPLGDRSEKCLGGVPAHAGLLVDLEIAAAFVVALVEVVDVGDAGLFGGAAKGVENRP